VNGYKKKLNYQFFNVIGVTSRRPSSFFIETCAHPDDRTEMPTRVTIRASESSSSPWGPWMVPLCNLPSERPIYNAFRPIFSRWESDSQNNPTGNRSTYEHSFKDFEDSKKMICGVDVPITETRCDNRLFNYYKCCLSYIIINNDAF